MPKAVSSSKSTSAAARPRPIPKGRAAAVMGKGVATRARAQKKVAKSDEIVVSDTDDRVDVKMESSPPPAITPTKRSATVTPKAPLKKVKFSSGDTPVTPESPSAGRAKRPAVILVPDSDTDEDGMVPIIKAKNTFIPLPDDATPPPPSQISPSAQPPLSTQLPPSSQRSAPRTPKKRASAVTLPTPPVTPAKAPGKGKGKSPAIIRGEHALGGTPDPLLKGGYEKDVIITSIGPVKYGSSKAGGTFVYEIEPSAYIAEYAIDGDIVKSILECHRFRNHRQFVNPAHLSLSHMRSTVDSCTVHLPGGNDLLAHLTSVVAINQSSLIDGRSIPSKNGPDTKIRSITAMPSSEYEWRRVEAFIGHALELPDGYQVQAFDHSITFATLPKNSQDPTDTADRMHTLSGKRFPASGSTSHCAPASGISGGKVLSFESPVPVFDATNTLNGTVYDPAKHIEDLPKFFRRWDAEIPKYSIAQVIYTVSKYNGNHVSFNLKGIVLLSLATPGTGARIGAPDVPGAGGSASRAERGEFTDSETALTEDDFIDDDGAASSFGGESYHDGEMEEDEEEDEIEEEEDLEMEEAEGIEGDEEDPFAA